MGKRGAKKTKRSVPAKKVSSTNASNHTADSVPAAALPTAILSSSPPPPVSQMTTGSESGSPHSPLLPNLDLHMSGHRASALWGAASNGHAEVVKLLLDAGTNTNSWNSLGQSVLWIAAVRGHNEVVRVLIEGGASLDAVASDGSTPILAAAAAKQMSIVALLNRSGARVDCGKDKCMRCKLVLKQLRQYVENEQANAEVEKREADNVATSLPASETNTTTTTANSKKKKKKKNRMKAKNSSSSSSSENCDTNVEVIEGQQPEQPTSTPSRKDTKQSTSGGDLEEEEEEIDAVGGGFSDAGLFDTLLAQFKNDFSVKYGNEGERART